MQRLQSRVVSSLRAAFHLATSPRRRYPATATPPARFVAESYLVATCGLTQGQARKASKHLSRLATNDRPEAVRAFLTGDLGLSSADVASAVARCPRILCCNVGKALAPRVSKLRGMGLSADQIAVLAPLAPCILVSPACVSGLAFYMSFLGSFDRVRAAVGRCPGLLGLGLEDTVKLNAELLRQCGLTARGIAQLFALVPALFFSGQERIDAVLARADELGVPRASPMFRHAVFSAYGVRRENAAARMELLKSFGWSDQQVAMAVAKMPYLLNSSDDRLRRAMVFLTEEAGLEVEAIARGPAMLKFSIEGRLRPRLQVIKLLKEGGLLADELSFYGVACMGEDTFWKTFVLPHEQSVPAVVDAYAAARVGK
ncbi:hypothetical protein ACP4OV_024426 [Aristida adscensionis]